ncbi:MAG TPA: hypothetical protein VHR66_07415 [Gemmataceae bacterium]|jgi:hypothetical protein|nr:hypothetical protein [Gemmataceae bacterium]
MKNTPSKRWVILASPQGHLTARPADYFRRWPDSYQSRWQRLTYVRVPRGIKFETVRTQVYGWAIWTYQL